jgi:hypothetical protein
MRILNAIFATISFLNLTYRLSPWIDLVAWICPALLKSSTFEKELNISFTWVITISTSRRKRRKNVGFHVPLLLHPGLFLHVIDIRDQSRRSSVCQYARRQHLLSHLGPYYWRWYAKSHQKDSIICKKNQERISRVLLYPGDYSKAFDIKEVEVDIIQWWAEAYTHNFICRASSTTIRPNSHWQN